MMPLSLSQYKKELLKREFKMESCDPDDITEHLDKILGRSYQLITYLEKNIHEHTTNRISQKEFALIETSIKILNWFVHQPVVFETLAED